MRFTPKELRTLDILKGLPESVLTWLTEHGTKVELAQQEHMFSKGQPASFMFVIVSGNIQRYEEIGGRLQIADTFGRGQVTGMLPYSRMTHYPGNAIAVSPSKVLRIEKKDFDKMLALSHELGQRLITQMSNRVRGGARLEQQHEKLVSLGRLSAGLAHELNNPAAAILRTSSSLAKRFTELQKNIMVITKSDKDKKSIDAIDNEIRIAIKKELSGLSPLQLDQRKEEFSEWLENKRIENAWNLSTVLSKTGLQIRDLERFSDSVSSDFLSDAFAWVAGYIEIDQMIAEIISSAENISDLVSSIKIYSHMDQSAEKKPTDIRTGFDNTLKIFAHKIKQKNIKIKGNYQEDLPSIPGNAGELNQVWTNLIDNAIDAMAEGGELRIEIKSTEWGVEAKIIDNGHGISAKILDRIFDPFFTTKKLGDGTGLGLDIAQRIVHQHGGQIKAFSKPGFTEMFVMLPFAPPEKKQK